jgi:hypothetical protein
MFLRKISEFEFWFKNLQRLNIFLYNFWSDDNAQAYKNGDMHYMESFYQTYISEMREISNELLTLQQQISEATGEVYRLEREIGELKRQPEIEGCYSAYNVDKDGYQISDWYAVSKKDVHRIIKDNIAGIHLVDRL